MIRLLRESAGDRRLYKFLIYPIPKIEGLEEDHYDQTLKAYLYTADYTYNIITRETNDRLITHADMRDSVPADIKNACGEDMLWGKTDCYLKDKSGNNPIRIWFGGNSGYLKPRMKEYLRNKFNAEHISST